MSGKPTPTLPSAQSLATMPTGTLTTEWFRFLSQLLAYAASLEARIITLENR